MNASGTQYGHLSNVGVIEEFRNARTKYPDLMGEVVRRFTKAEKDRADLLAALEAALPTLRSEYLRLAEKYSGTAYENDLAYKQVEARFRNAETAIAAARGQA